jgi:hypothetical protein
MASLNSINTNWFGGWLKQYSTCLSSEVLSSNPNTTKKTGLISYLPMSNVYQKEKYIIKRQTGSENTQERYEDR